MSSGKTHDKINHYVIYFIFASFIIGFIYLTFGKQSAEALFIFLLGYYFGSYCFGPDLDIKSRPYRRWGKIRFIWKPYQKIFHHRSLWTHGFIIGDVVRILYLIGIIFPFYAGSVVLFNLDSESINKWLLRNLFTHQVLYLSFLVGIIIASTVHIISDRIYSANKKMNRKKKKKKK